MRKKCRKCLELLDAAYFYKDVRNKNGLRSYCKRCQAQDSAEWNKRKLLEKVRGNCATCGISLTGKIGGRKYCSQKCRDKHSWQIQKVDPQYKEYHRKIAREWQQKNRAGKNI